MPTSIAEAGYELSQNAISEQNERLGELRGRTATLLAAASLAASFLGGQSIRAGDLGVVGVLALIAYLVCVGAEAALEVAAGWFEAFLEDNRK